MKIAIIGATGLVGSTILKVLEERNFNVTELIPVASNKSAGKTINFKGEKFGIKTIEEAIILKPDIAIFSAGSDVSLEFAPQFAQVGTFVIDNSSAWRMHPDHKLIVPEINASTLTVQDKIIANPNCSTIQMVMVLAPIHNLYKIQRIVVSTYQSITGTGVKAVNQMENERNGISGDMAYKYPIDKNCIPQIDVFLENGYTKEEMKMVNETRKILNSNYIQITSTCVRIPVVGGHSESVNIQTEKPFTIDNIKSLISDTAGVVLMDDIDNQIYPMPLLSKDKDEVLVGRVRLDESIQNGLNMWIVADNLRKGAATNAVQIAEYIAKEIL
ncbi:MAG: aspartate-semialdehyde dehydrogenase [Bacteroidia bacterium]